jgi:hypothetical protein
MRVLTILKSLIPWRTEALTVDLDVSEPLFVASEAAMVILRYYAINKKAKFGL